jgi:tetratricopeptide (TPR) repeat protein
VLDAAFGDTLRRCALDGDGDCCRAMPCRRGADYDRAGYRLLVQASCDRDLREAVPRSADLVLVTLREPTLRALSAYGQHLVAAKQAHSLEYLQHWLAGEALYSVDFWRKWAVADIPRRAVLRFDALLAKPRESLDAALAVGGIHLDESALDRAAAAVDPGRDADLDIAALDSNPHFVRQPFVEFLNLVAQEADYMGFTPWRDPKEPSGPVTTLYRARRAMRSQNHEEALAVLQPFVAINPVHSEVRAMLAQALLEAGREVEGRRAMETLLQAEPDYWNGYILLAAHAFKSGLAVEARGYLREAASRPGGAAPVGRFLRNHDVDAAMARQFPAEPEPPVARDAVIAGFRWILGRLPESEVVIRDHRNLADDDALRLALMRSDEFRAFYGRFERGEVLADPAEVPVPRADVIDAVHWLLGRPLRARAEADELLTSGSPAALRLRLVASEEFQDSHRHAVTPPA